METGESKLTLGVLQGLIERGVNDMLDRGCAGCCRSMGVNIFSVEQISWLMKLCYITMLPDP
eukprot:SAG11_NODE_27202_length_335_cov_1.296610_2_plen_61_part_01